MMGEMIKLKKLLDSNNKWTKLTNKSTRLEMNSGKFQINWFTWLSDPTHNKNKVYVNKNLNWIVESEIWSAPEITYRLILTLPRIVSIHSAMISSKALWKTKKLLRRLLQPRIEWPSHQFFWRKSVFMLIKLYVICMSLLKCSQIHVKNNHQKRKKQ